MNITYISSLINSLFDYPHNLPQFCFLLSSSSCFHFLFWLGAQKVLLNFLLIKVRQFKINFRKSHMLQQQDGAPVEDVPGITQYPSEVLGLSCALRFDIFMALVLAFMWSPENSKQFQFQSIAWLHCPVTMPTNITHEDRGQGKSAAQTQAWSAVTTGNQQINDQNLKTIQMKTDARHQTSNIQTQEKKITK